MVCFDVEEVKNMIKSPQEQQIIEKILERGYTLQELEEDMSGDMRKTMEVVGSCKIIEDKEDLEIFLSTYEFQSYYPDSKICYYLKNGVDPKSIKSLDDLKRSIVENNINDFAIYFDKSIRNFQLKTYRGNINVKDFFSFLSTKLSHYANNLGDTNLLIVLSKGGSIDEKSFFNSIHKELKKINIEGKGHILITYNEENKFSNIITVYPKLGKTQRPKTFYSK